MLEYIVLLTLLILACKQMYHWYHFRDFSDIYTLFISNLAHNHIYTATQEHDWILLIQQHLDASQIKFSTLLEIQDSPGQPNEVLNPLQLQGRFEFLYPKQPQVSGSMPTDVDFEYSALEQLESADLPPGQQNLGSETLEYLVERNQKKKSTLQQKDVRQKSNIHVMSLQKLKWLKE